MAMGQWLVAVAVLATSSNAFLLPTPLVSSSVRRAERAPQVSSLRVSSLTGSSTVAVAGLLAVAAATLRRSLTQRRLRLAGKDIPRNKELAYALICSVYGIGKTTAFKICVDTSLDPHKIVAELTEEEELRLSDEIGKYVLENPLRRMTKANCKTLLEIKHRRGVRLQKGLPVRFQRSKTNNRNARKLNPGRI